MQDPIFERIESLLKDKGKSQREFDSDLGFSRSTYSNWKQNRSKSYLRHIDEIARYFGVSTSYLVRGVDDEREGFNTAMENELLSGFRKLSSARQECVLDIVKTLLVD